jgi:hypothetical protein
MIKGRQIVFVAIAAVVLSLAAGCVVADRSDGRYGRHETYYYYPDDEVYFYPATRLFYWLDFGEWRHDRQAPRRYRLDERRRVKLDLDYEPHTQHPRIRKNYPPHRDDRDRDQDRDRDRDRDKDRD